MVSRILVGRKSFLVLIFFSGDEMVLFSPLDVEKGFSCDYFKVRLRLTMKKTLEKPFSTSRGEKSTISTPEKKIATRKFFLSTWILLTIMKIVITELRPLIESDFVL